MSVEVSKDGLRATIRIPGWPLMVVDTPLGKQRFQEAVARMEATFEEAYRCEMNDRLYRLRCQKIDGKYNTDGAVCEYLYSGEWHRMKNQDMLLEIKEMANNELDNDSESGR